MKWLQQENRNNRQQNQAKQNSIQFRQTNCQDFGNVSKLDFLTGKDVLLEKDSLEKANTIKRFEHSPLESELKQTDIARSNIKN